MKKTLLIIGLCLSSICATAQKDKTEDSAAFVFETVVENPITSIKSQNLSSTCWSFSALALVEAELLRMGKGEYDLSEMFVVHKTMQDRARNYVRLHGQSSFSPGGSFYDIIYNIKHYGLVPQEVMPGIMYDDTAHNHSELDAVAEGYVEALVTGRRGKLTDVWANGLASIYDAYLGACPESFEYQGVEYTPTSFAASLEINPDDYVSITSYIHHPFYSEFAVEVPDNWRGSLSKNLPLDEFMDVMDAAVRGGYTIAWGSDVSEDGFSRDGLATTPEETITQELRQKAYDNWQTQDDHGMLIYGIAKDQNGKEYFMVKNSWHSRGDYNGTWYVSKDFVAYKTINIVVHKDAIPADIAAKLGL